MNQRLAIVSFALVTALACSPGVAQELVVRIGTVAPLTGPLAHLGKDSQNSAQLAVDELNSKGVLIGGRKAKFVLIGEDDAGDPELGVAAAKKLVDAKVSGVVGHLNSGTSIPASKIYSEAGIPQISPSATNPMFTRQGYKTTFRVVADDTDLGAALGKYSVTELKGKSVAVIDDRTAYGQAVADEFEKGVIAAGGKISARQFTTDKARDFTAVLSSVKRSSPDVVFYGGMDATAGPLFLQARQLGIQAKFIGGDGICTNELPKLAGGAMASGQVVCGEAGGSARDSREGLENFKSKYKTRFNADVQNHAPYVYDSVNLLVTAMVKAGSSEPTKYLPELAKTDSYKGVTGTITFDQKGDIRYSAMTLYTYKGDQRVQMAVVGQGSPVAVNQNRVVTVFFATDRKINGQAADVKTRYTDERGDLVYGTAEVSVPPGHIMGMIERPSWLRSEQPSKHMILKSAQLTAEKAFYEKIRSLVNPSAKQAFVFIHGYNVSFEDAALRTGQLAADLGIGAIPVFYSWPSRGATAQYTRDEQAAEWTQANMTKFLEDFADRSGADELLIIAHSMGSRALTRSMGSLFERRKDLRKRFSEIVLAAPDIDADVFVQQILPRLKGTGTRLTLYASSRDKALQASVFVHGHSRAGLAGEKLVLAPGLETIDASEIDTDFLGHSVYSSTRVLLTDMTLLFRNRMGAELRPGLDLRTSAAKKYWRVRP